MNGERIRVKGLVQGVGFRPLVWRLARDNGLRGEVLNDGAGVEIRLCGTTAAIDNFCRQLQQQPPPLARIDRLERQALDTGCEAEDFRIVASQSGAVHTGIVPDAATCPACRSEIFDPNNRRHRYPFTNCTHCGPRLTIVRGIPYDRANTSMSAFPLCPRCAAEYRDPADRRFHAQPNACPDCGPQVWLEEADGHRPDCTDAIAEASRRLRQGAILALKGIGGFHLACDATHPQAVATLRRRKQRFAKPFALMARDVAVIRRYCALSSAEIELLHSPAAPIVLLDSAGESLPAAVAPGQTALGFMLPYSPLHHLLLADWDSPLIMTSANRSEEPQCTDNDEARQRLRAIADGWLLHDRAIVNRVDDSVVRFMAGQPRLLRRARGYAPAPLPLPEAFASSAPLLALGGDLKNTFCLLQDGHAILSQHHGDLEEVRTAAAYQHSLNLYQTLLQHRPRRLVGDLHPGYHSTRLGRRWAREMDIPFIPVQHHHAHIAAVLADNAWPLEAGAVLGIALDGLGYGDDGSLWGGEILRADYNGYRRLARLQPVPLLGGDQAGREPWRNAYAHIMTHFGWETFSRRWGDSELGAFFQRQELALFSAMFSRGINSPPSSSCGRLFDAVAAALGIGLQGISYEGQAAIELEALAQQADWTQCAPLPFEWRQNNDGLWEISARPCWEALLDGLRAGVPRAVLAAGFHLGLAVALSELSTCLAEREGLCHVALSGGVMQNRALFERLEGWLKQAGLQVLSHHQVPASDGSLALGQAVIGALR